MGETTEGTSSIVKFGETAFERGLWKSRGTLHARRSRRNCWIHFGEYFMHADWNLSQNSRNALPLDAVDQLVKECKKWDAVVAGVDKMCKNTNPLQGYKFDCTNGLDSWTKNTKWKWSTRQNKNDVKIGRYK